MVGHARLGSERGAAAVEFALVVPFLMLILFGMITTGLTYSDHLSVTNAVREGARYGAGLDFTDANWGTSVRDRVKQVYFNSGSPIDDKQICVKVVDSSNTHNEVAGSNHWIGTQCGAAPDLTTPPFKMSPGSCAVVVWATRPASIQLIIAPSLNFHIGAKSIAYYGLTVGTSCTAK